MAGVDDGLGVVLGVFLRQVGGRLAGPGDRISGELAAVGGAVLTGVNGWCWPSMVMAGTAMTGACWARSSGRRLPAGVPVMAEFPVHLPVHVVVGQVVTVKPWCGLWLAQ